MDTKNNLFFLKDYLKLLALITGAVNVLLWILFLSALALSLGTDGPKGDFGHSWISWVSTHLVVSIPWTALGVYSFIKFIKFMDKVDAKVRN